MADTFFATTSSGENLYRFLVALFAFVVVIIATYYVSKWMAGYQKTRMTGHNFEVIDSLRIGTNKYFMLVRVGRNKYYSIGVGKDEMVMLGELSEDEVVLFHKDSDAKSGRERMDFSGLLASFRLKQDSGADHEE